MIKWVHADNDDCALIREEAIKRISVYTPRGVSASALMQVLPASLLLFERKLQRAEKINQN